MPTPQRLAQYYGRLFLFVLLPLMLMFVLGLTVEIIQQIGQEAFHLFSFLLNVLANMLPGLLAMFAILLAASWHLSTLYELGGLRQGWEFLQLLLFEQDDGQLDAKPFLVIKEGKLPDGHAPLIRVGGPGLLIIYNDSAVVTEQNGRLCRVLGPGYSRLGNFERIWEVIDLRPQHWLYPVGALTRDGIPITCAVDVTFRIDDRTNGLAAEPTEARPYPYTEDAVLKAALSVRVREEEREDTVMKWTGRVVIGNAEGALRGILARYRLDQLIQPDQPGLSNTVREEIRRDLTKSLEASSPGVGAKILSVDIGAVDVKVDLPEGEKQEAEKLQDEVLQQWIDTWKAELERIAVTQSAVGEAELISLESVSVQAQAEMVLTLIEAVQSLITAEEASAYRLAIRFIETLRWMSFDPNSRSFMSPEALRSLHNLREAVERSALPPGSPQSVGEKK